MEVPFEKDFKFEEKAKDFLLDIVLEVPSDKTNGCYPDSLAVPGHLDNSYYGHPWILLFKALKVSLVQFYEVYLNKALVIPLVKALEVPLEKAMDYGSSLTQSLGLSLGQSHRSLIG